MLNTDRLIITPLGGLGEIGLNSMTFRYGQDMVLVDCGLMFPEDYHLGVDVVIPRFDHVVENRDKLRGIVLTHGHEDHIGALPWLVPQLENPRIYGSPFTLGLVAHKLRERNLLDRAELVTVRPEAKLKLGSFAFHFFPVAHSIIDGLALGLDTPVGKVIHTGDFKLDNAPLYGQKVTDLGAIRRFAGPSGVHLLLSDSTNIENAGFSLNEKQVFSSLRSVFAEAKGRILVTLFSSNIQRIQEVFDCAQETGRKVIVGGRSLLNNIEIAKSLGYISIPGGLCLELSEMPRDLPDNQVVLLLTGSQGEPMSALSRIVSGEHKQIAIHAGDTVLMSSRLIPDNATAVNRMVNQLYRHGAEVYNSDVRGIHASGHAYRDELAMMFEAANPEFFVPIHGEYRHLVKHAQLARTLGLREDKVFVLENGHSLSIGPHDAFRATPILAESILVDGKGVGDVGHAVLKERQILGYEGMVIVLLLLDARGREVVLGPEVLSKGFVFEQQFSHVLEDSACIVLDILEEEFTSDIDKLQEKIRSAMRRFFRRVLGRDPVVVPMVRVI